MVFSNQLAQFRRWCRRDLVTFCKWTVLSVLVGVLVGIVGSLFAHGLIRVTSFRKTHFWVLFLLPVAGLAIVGMYHLLDMDNDGGTEFILASVRDARHLHFRMLPLIFLSTLLTHLTGGSAGREGAALQIGGSVGHNIGRLLRLDDRDERVITVGVMYYSAIIPCILSALLARWVAQLRGSPPRDTPSTMPPPSPLSPLSSFWRWGGCAPLPPSSSVRECGWAGCFTAGSRKTAGCGRRWAA